MPFGRGRCWHIEGEVHWRIVELTEIDYGFQKKGRKFLSSWATVSWSRRALLHGIGNNNNNNNNNNNIRPVYSYYELPELIAVDRLILTMCYYLGADKSLARPGRKQGRKHVRNARFQQHWDASCQKRFSCKARRRRKFTPFWQKH